MGLRLALGKSGMCQGLVVILGPSASLIASVSFRGGMMVSQPIKARPLVLQALMKPLSEFDDGSWYVLLTGDYSWKPLMVWFPVTTCFKRGDGFMGSSFHFWAHRPLQFTSSSHRIFYTSATHTSVLSQH